MRLIDIEEINWYDDLFMKGENHSGVWVRYRDVEKLIRNSPTVDAVPVVRGEWQEIPGLDDVPIKVYACSICRRAIKVPCSLCIQEIAPFCHCGADMRKVVEIDQVKEGAE